MLVIFDGRVVDCDGEKPFAVVEVEIIMNSEGGEGLFSKQFY